MTSGRSRTTKWFFFFWPNGQAYIPIVRTFCYRSFHICVICIHWEQGIYLHPAKLYSSCKWALLPHAVMPHFLSNRSGGLGSTYQQLAKSVNVIVQKVKLYLRPNLYLVVTIKFPNISIYFQPFALEVLNWN